MRAMLVILRAEAQRGGAERYTRDLAATLASRGVDVLTVATGFDPDWPGGKREVRADAMTRAGRYWQFLDGVDRAAKENPEHVVHAMLPVRRAHLYHPHAGVAAVPKRSPLLEPFNRRRRRMGEVERELVGGGRPALTLALSEYLLGHLRRFYPQAPAEVLLNGVDLGRFDPALVERENVEAIRAAWGVKEGEHAALCVAQDFRRKGVHLAIEALARVPGCADKLVVIGRDDPGPMAALASKLGVGDRVAFPGATRDTRAAYAAASAFVLPTAHDPCPLVTVEALAMGVPVISTPFNGACEWMEDGVHGRITGLEPGEIGRALAEFRVAETRERARREIGKLRPRLDVRVHVDRLVETYRRVLNRLPD